MVCRFVKPCGCELARLKVDFNAMHAHAHGGVSNSKLYLNRQSFDTKTWGNISMVVNIAPIQSAVLMFPCLFVLALIQVRCLTKTMNYLVNFSKTQGHSNAS